MYEKFDHRPTFRAALACNHVVFLFICFILSGLTSCQSEKLDDSSQQGDISYLVIQGGPMTRADFPADGLLDNEIVTLRIMAFDRTGSRTIRSNKKYSAENGDIIKHLIEAGTYDFVFIANEPSDWGTSSMFENIGQYSNLSDITFPEEAVNSTKYIPMSQEISNVEVLPNSAGVKVTGNSLYPAGNTYNPLQLKLSRLATRVDILLEAEENLDAHFKGVTFSGIPDYVPVVGTLNEGADRDVTRSFTLAANSQYFTKLTPTTEQQAAGIVWCYKITRFILPYNNFNPTTDADKAVTFTVNMENRFSPYCKLKIQTAGVDGATADNYTLPRDVALLLKGKVTMPLELNIQVSPWDKESANWQMQNRELKVSQTEVNITDFNGARITFSSDLPKVHILPQLTMRQTLPAQAETTAETESIFNDLVPKDGDIVDNGGTITYTTTRFSYIYDKTTKTGTGYMDILLDEYNIGNVSEFNTTYPNGREATFRLILSGEDQYGGKLEREITVNTRQYGIRESIVTGWYGNAPYRYSGAFFREDETGERIITAQVPRLNGELGTWTATVDSPYKDLIVLSTTPSFDPQVGTDNPGVAEQYPVRVNEYKASETGSSVSGRGRMYFRVAWKTPNPNGTYAEGKKIPRYATISYTVADRTGSLRKIYLRQGEAADYIMTNGDVFEVLDNNRATGITLTRNKARRISPFNITDPNMLGKGKEYTSQYEQTPVEGGVFVEFPSQAGAFYQWYVHKTSAAVRRAFHPTNPTSGVSGWLGANDAHYPSLAVSPVWATTAHSTPPETPPKVTAAYYDAGYGAVLEVCPDGYHRPSDGYTDRVSFNGIYPNFRITLGGTIGNYYNPVTTVSCLAGDRPDYREEVKESEWRQSLWSRPWAGETVSGTTETEVSNTTVMVMRERNAPISNTNDGYADMLRIQGFYADGFFDRRPIKTLSSTSTSVGVALDTPGAAYRGMIVYNNTTKASLFFPSGGRRNNQWGYLDAAGSTGFYWSSSLSPTSPTGSGYHNRAAWGLETNYSTPGHIYTVTTTGHTIRCFKDE